MLNLGGEVTAITALLDVGKLFPLIFCRLCAVNVSRGLAVLIAFYSLSKQVDAIGDQRYFQTGIQRMIPSISREASQC